MRYWDTGGLRNGPSEVSQSFAVDGTFDHDHYYPCLGSLLLYAVNKTLLHLLAWADSYLQLPLRLIHTLYGDIVTQHRHTCPSRVMRTYTLLCTYSIHECICACRYTFYTQCCPPPLSTNVFCCISMKSTVGEQDGIPHILQRYLRTWCFLPLCLSFSLSALGSLPSWGHDLVMKKQHFYQVISPQNQLIQLCSEVEKVQCKSKRDSQWKPTCVAHEPLW